jgi:hypothetical protein
MPLENWIQHSRLDQFLYDWQTLIAGGFALVAAFGTVVATIIIANRQITASREEAKRVIAVTREQTETTVRLERERVSGEVDALRKSLGVELRLQITTALRVHDDLLGLLSGGPISARMVDSKSRAPAPIIYSANASKIGLLEDDAMDVVLVYTLLEAARDRVDRLITYRTPDHVATYDVPLAAEAFLEACRPARGVLPRLRTGIASHDAATEELIQKINAADSASTVYWQGLKTTTGKPLDR